MLDRDGPIQHTVPDATGPHLARGAGDRPCDDCGRIAVIAVVPELRHRVSLVIHGQFAELRSYVRSLGARGFSLLLGLILADAIVFYPSEIAIATAG